MTVREVAKAANVSKPTAYRLVHSGQFPAVRVGTGRAALRVPREPFLAWLYGTPEDAA